MNQMNKSHCVRFVTLFLQCIRFIIVRPIKRYRVVTNINYSNIQLNFVTRLLNL